jgi:hypothetical protein
MNAPFRAWLIGRRLAAEQQNARVAIEWMTRRLRLAGVGVAAGTGAYFTEATTTAVTFLADVNGDGAAELHRFCLDGAAGVIREQVAGAVTTGCTTGAPITAPNAGRSRIALLAFAYFDGYELLLTPPLAGTQLAGVARVGMTLGLDSNASGSYDAGSDATFSAAVLVRND